MTQNNFSKIGLLIKFILRLDRIRLPVWLFGILFFTVIVPPAFKELYPTQPERDTMAETMNNPALIAMVGPADLSNYTIGVMTSHQMLLITALVVGLMGILLITRHTRADEEDGRLELVRSLPVGRLSMLNASLIVIVGANLLLAMITGFVLASLGIEGMDLEGSLLYGASLGVTGILFASVTAFFAQLTESSRGTIGLSFAVLFGAYFVRAVGDVSVEALSWISPLGWIPMTEVYANNHWWPIGLMLILSIGFVILANYLNSIRDLGAGLLPSKDGKIHASPFLQSPIGLALRLQRTGLISWAIGMILLGLSYGSVFGDLESFFEGNELLVQMFGGEDGYSFTDSFISTLMVVIALLAAVPPIMSMLKLYSEEKKERIEHILSRAVSRTKLLVSYLVISVVNGFVMLSLSAIGLWAAGNTVVEGGLDFWGIYYSALTYYPAMLVLIGLAVIIIGFKPKLTIVIWLYLFYSFIVLYFGNLFQLSDWIGKLSPFGHIPAMPVEEFELLPVIILLVIAIMLMIAGTIGYNRRDIKN
ncbi:ABC transporter permease [Bacillaceae bacterium W0354]